jgi:hypothetical protein
MNRRFLLAFLVLACSALPARAGGFGYGFDFRLSGSIQANGWCNGSGCGYPGCGPCYPGCGPVVAPLAPWYLYWPMEAHFQTPAPMTYPFWPSPQTPPPGVGSPLQPASYYPAPPPYWYGR